MFLCEFRKNKYVDGLRRVNKNKNIFTAEHKLYNGICEIKQEEMIPVECKAGSLIIFDTNCIHSGGTYFEDNKERRVVRLHIDTY